MTTFIDSLPKIWLSIIMKEPIIIPKEEIEPTIRQTFKEIQESGENFEHYFRNENNIYLFRLVGESFIREYIDYIYDWKNFWYAFRASEDFIREAPIKIWYEIAYYQKLSEPFIEEFKNELDWDIISRRQVLSEDFCWKHKKDVNWACIRENQEWYKWY